MKWYNGVMSVLTILCVAIVLFVLTGCGVVDQHQYERDKAESEYRKGLEDTNKPAPGYGGDIGMPKEWMDQWPSEQEEK